MSSARQVTVWLVVTAFGLTGTARALEIGDVAPELAIAHWLKGKPFKMADAKGKNVVVVECWATWCGPCRQTIPQLNRLQARRRDDGVLVVGITKEKPAHVRTWLGQKPGLDIGYHVGVDPGEDTYQTYMMGAEGIPHVTVVAKTGRVVWHGIPWYGLDYVIGDVLAGTFDVKAAAKVIKLDYEYMTAIGQKDTFRAMALVDQMIAIQPRNPAHHERKLDILDTINRPREARALRRAMVKTFDRDADVLAKLAVELVSDADLSNRDLASAMAAARRAVELTGRKDSVPLEALGRVYAELGLWDEAIAAEQQAVAVTASKSRASVALQYYRRAKALAAKHAAKQEAGPAVR